MWLGTVGRRTSGEYFRLYDKGVETRDHVAGIRWRLELEAKYKHAEALWAEQAEALKDPRWCAQYVTSRWRSLGCSFPYPPNAESLDAVRPEPRPSPSFVDTLKWLETTVQPAVRRCLMACTTREVLRALGLDAIARPVDDETTNGGGA